MAMSLDYDDAICEVTTEYTLTGLPKSQILGATHFREAQK